MPTWNTDPLRYAGDATEWDDMRFPAFMLKQGGVKDPTTIAYSAGYVEAFSYQGVEGNEERLFGIAQLPHGYKEGSDIEFHVHWVPETADNAAVGWKLTYEWMNIDGTFSSTSTIEATQAINNEADKHIYTDVGTITGTSKTISSMILFELRRHSSDGADTFDDLAYLLEADFHFEIDAMGSKEETSKD